MRKVKMIRVRPIRGCIVLNSAGMDAEVGETVEVNEAAVESMQAHGFELAPEAPRVRLEPKSKKSGPTLAEED